MSGARGDEDDADAEADEADAAGDADPELPDQMFFRIGEAAELVGVEPHVLRYWETEFSLAPSRSASGQRLYRRADIARFVQVRRLLHDEGFTIAGARKALEDPGAGEPTPPGVDAARIDQAADRLRQARARIAALRARVSTALGGGGP